MRPDADHHRETHKKPVHCFNAATNCPCGWHGLILDLPVDNPQQSEETSHIRHAGKCKCWKCLAGGINGFNATAEGYHVFYEVGDEFT
jgi:hypothetical protein